MTKYIFFTQVGVTASIITFCIAMLVKGESASIYLPVLTGISGWWLPSPKHPKEASAVASPKEPDLTEVVSL